jgi:hypothetical protein
VFNNNSGKIRAGARASRFPERSQRPFYQTKPVVISGEWVDKSDQIVPETVSPNEANTSSDVLRSEKC